MIVKENISVYQCEFCKKKLFVKSAMEHHEKYCSSNPDNFKACQACMHLEEISIEYQLKRSDEILNLQTTGFWCAKLDKKMYPTKAQRKKLPEKYPETFKDQVPMPKECDHVQVYSL